MPYDDGFNTWFYDENGNKVFIGPRIEFNSRGGELEVELIHDPADEAKARAAGYEHVSTTVTIDGRDAPAQAAAPKSMLRRLLGM